MINILSYDDGIFAYRKYRGGAGDKEGVHSAEECEQAKRCPVIIHYAGDKPWKRYDTNLGYLWWDYVNSQSELQDLFDEKAARRCHGHTLWDRGVRKVKKILNMRKERGQEE